MKSTDRILARRYARAYEALSKDAVQATDACKALQVAASALEGARAYMQDPAVPTVNKVTLVQELFGEKEQVAHFLAALLTAKRYYLLESCVMQVQDLLDERQGIVRPKVETAYALNPTEKKQVEQTLSKFTGKTAQAQFSVQPELLGGLRVRMGDTLIDGSLKGRFEKLQQELTK